MFNRIKLSMILGKLNNRMPLTESIYARDKPAENLTLLFEYSIGALSLTVQLLEEAVIFAAKKRTRTIHFPEAKDMVDRMLGILAFIDLELQNKRHLYPDGPALAQVQSQWEALVGRLAELLQQVEVIP